MIALYIIYLLRTPLTWLFIATFLAIALSGPVAFLSRWMKRGFAIAIVYLGLLLFPLVLAACSSRRSSRRPTTSPTTCRSTRRTCRTSCNNNRTLRKLEEDYNFTEQINEEARKLPAKIGDAAGVLSNIGIGMVSSLFAVSTS